MKNRYVVINFFFLSAFILTAPFVLNGPNAQPLSDYLSGNQARFVHAYFPDNETALKILHMYEDKCFEISYEQGYIVMQANARDIEELSRFNMTVTPYPEYDLQHNRYTDRGQKAGIPGYPCYRLVEESFSFMDSVCAAYPKLASIVDIGDSWDKTQGSGGYDLKVLRLTNSDIPGPKPKLYINGSLHAREYTTAELVNRFITYLVTNYGKDADVTWMLDYHEFHGEVYANPDGRKYAEKGQMWRKNTNKNYCASNANQRGADLNRNFEYNWSASTDQCGETFSGASAASEPETKAIQDYMKQIFPVKKEGIYIDLHAYAQTNMTSSAAELKILARKFSFFNKYNYYEERGMTFEYANSVIGIAGFLIELGTAFFEKCTFFESDLIPKHIPLFLYALRAAREPFTMPSGPDVMMPCHSKQQAHRHSLRHAL
jgi:murein tripeptide amidase MpaA